MLEDTYAHTPVVKMFDNADVYGIAFDEKRAARKRVRLGIIGAGGVAQSKHLPAIMRLKTIWEPLDVPAICIRRREQGEKVAAMYGARHYADYREMIGNEQMDGVLILASDAAHREMGLACMEAGLHVMIEKPLARSLAEARELCECAEKNGRILMTVSNKRYSPPYRRARQTIAKGVLADPAMFVGKFNLGYDYVDILEGGTIHIFDIMRYLMGDVREVTGFGVRKYEFNRTRYPFDNATLSFRFASGSVGTIYTSATALSLKPWERVEVYGEKCWLAVEDQRTLILNDSEEGGSKVWEPVFPNTLMFDEEFGGFMGLIENFAGCIRGEDKPLVDGRDGYKALELAIASHIAVAEGGTVALPLDPVGGDRKYAEIMAGR